jgi:hypothetical protein
MKRLKRKEWKKINDEINKKIGKKKGPPVELMPFAFTPNELKNEYNRRQGGRRRKLSKLEIKCDSPQWYKKGAFGYIPSGLEKELESLGVVKKETKKLADWIARIILRGIANAYGIRVATICRERDQRKIYKEEILGITTKYKQENDTEVAEEIDSLET